MLDIDQSLEQMIWRIVAKYAGLSELPLAVPSRLAYALFDGVFQQALLGHPHGDTGAADELAVDVARVLDGFVVTGS